MRRGQRWVVWLLGEALLSVEGGLIWFAESKTEIADLRSRDRIRRRELPLGYRRFSGLQRVFSPRRSRI